MKHQENKTVWIFCAMTAALLLAICSKCSFLYPLNDWVDANIYFTMGKGMLNGRVLYRDIYDHKGPFLYFLHGLAILISNRSFLGVYLIEIVAFTCFLAAAWKILRLYCTDVAIWGIPVLAAVILAMTFSTLFTLVPLLKQVSAGIAIVICTVAAAAICAALFPIKDEEEAA